MTGSAGTGTGNRAAVLVPGADTELTRQLSRDVAPLATPPDWSGVLARAPDGSRRLAVARWAGAETAPLQLHDERGAPITRAPATVHGQSTQVEMALDAPAAHGEVVRLFVRTDQPLRARATGAGRALLVNHGDHPATLNLTGLDRDGAVYTTTGTLDPGRRAQVVLQDGVFTFRDARRGSATPLPADHGCAPVDAGTPC